eukprot:335066_1
MAGSYTRWTQRESGRAASSIFGYSLEEVQAYDEKMKANDAAINSTSDEKKGVYDGTWAEMQAIGVKENAYSTDTPDTLASAKGALDEALNQRGEAYQKELARQVHND